MPSSRALQLLRHPVLWIVLMALSVAGAAWAGRALHLGWIGIALTMMLLAALLAGFIKAANGRALDQGCASAAMLRYNRRMMIASLAYMAGLFAATFVYKQAGGDLPLLWLVATLPSIGAIGMVWAMARLILEEEDEYLRSRVVNSALIALGFLLVVCTIWGFFEQFRLVPHVPSWAAIPVFALGLGFGRLAQRVGA